MMDLVVEKSMEEMKKLTDAFESNDMAVLKNRIRETNRKIKKIQTIVSEMNDPEIMGQF